MKRMLYRYLIICALFATSTMMACADGDSGEKNALVEDTGTPSEPHEEEEQEDDTSSDEETEDEEEDTSDDDDSTTPPEDDMPVNDDDDPSDIEPSQPDDGIICADGRRFTQWHGPALRQGHAATTFPLESCAPDGVITIMPRGTQWRYTVSGLSEGDIVRVYTAHYFSDERVGELRAPQIHAPVSGSGTAMFDYKAIHGGEQVLVVHTNDLEATGEFTVETTCRSQCDRYTTRFPLVFVHGFLGTQNYFGLFEYWNGILDPLRANGTEAFDPSSSLIESSAARAVKVAEGIDDALAVTGARKVNLIGHSQGGTDSRIIASPNGLQRDSNISSITTIATPHHGVPIPLLSFLSDAINFLFDFPDFSESEAKAFNRKYTDSTRVEYYSWSFRTCASIDYICQISSGGKLRPTFDIFGGQIGVGVVGGEVVNDLLSIPHALIAATSFLGGTGADNDGLVTVKSAYWGPKENQYGPIWADHVDQIGQIMRDPNSEQFNHVTFYQDLVKDYLIPNGH